MVPVHPVAGDEHVTDVDPVLLTEGPARLRVLVLGPDVERVVVRLADSVVLAESPARPLAVVLGLDVVQVAVCPVDLLCVSWPLHVF